MAKHTALDVKVKSTGTILKDFNMKKTDLVDLVLF